MTDDLIRFDRFRTRSMSFHIEHISPENIKILQGGLLMTNPTQRRELDEQGHQLANLTEGDPGNTDPELLTAPLDADDDVFGLVHPHQGQTAPTSGEHQS